MTRLLALDIGERRIGIARSDTLGWIAYPLQTLHRKSWAEDLACLRQLFTQNDIHELVVGLPLNMDGSEGGQATFVRNATARIQAEFPDVAVHFEDERLSTVEAEDALRASGMKRHKRKQVLDQQAAVVILQQFIEKRRSPTGGVCT